MKKCVLLFLVFVGFVFDAFADEVFIGQFDVGAFDAITNSYYLRNIETFYDDETGLVGYSYNRDQANKVRYNFNFSSQNELDGTISRLEDCLKIIRGEKNILEINGEKGNELTDRKGVSYEFSAMVDVERDEVVNFGSVSSVVRSFSTLKLSFFIKEGSKNLCIGGDKVTFVPGNRKVSLEILGLNENALSKFISSLKKENLDAAQRVYFEYSDTL